jgi:hypothetical protein
VSDVSHLAKPSKTSRGKVANGTRLHTVDVDGRTAEARRFRDIFAEIVSDLGGAEGLSEAQRQLARRATLMSVQCELLEASSITGTAIDLDTYGQLSDRLGRAFTRLGIKRTARVVDVNPLAEHFSRPVARPAL